MAGINQLYKIITDETYWISVYFHPDNNILMQ